MKRNAIIRIVLFSIAIVLLVSILAGGLLLNTAFVNMDWSSILQNEWTSFDGELSSVGSVPASEIKNIQVDWAAGSITIVPGDVDSISFSENDGLDENHQMVWSKQGNTLVIRYSKTQVYFGFRFDAPKNLLITVPRDWSCNELEIDAASAKVCVNDLTIHTVDFDGASGVCEFVNCNVDHMDLDTASGDIKFTGTLTELDCDAASASCVLHLSNTPLRIDADMASGDLRLTLPEDCGFTVKLDALSGDFTSDFSTVTQNGKYIYGDGSCDINVSAMSGDVTIRKTEKSAG